MYVGVDYYPEHWPRERWATDARLMQEAGFNIVRLAEFAWVFMEPEEGRFEFAWLDDALGILAEHGISAILGTPTAVMPAWVARKYPETLAMQLDGQRKVWGVRKNNCFTSGAYRFLSERITRAMAEHFANTPNVIGWQTDNEFDGAMCYCDTCRADFQDWLRAKYKTLDALNAAWGTHFWGQCYGTWGEIPVPDNMGTQNPSLCLDWKRYNSWLNVRFQHDQVRIMRDCCPNHFITHNFMGMFNELDYYDLAEDLNFVSWDNYPVWGNISIPYDASAGADMMRGLKRQNFWIMEQTAGPGGWGAFGRNPRPGEIRKIAYQQLAHGADGQIWFRWRTCTAGREQYWHGLLGHDGRPLRRYQEAAQTAQEYHALAAELDGTTVQAEVAIVMDYDSIWALKIQPGYGENNYHDAMRHYYQALFRAGINADFIPSTADFAAYKVVIAPDLYILPDAVADRLHAYVEAGGILLTDCRTGVKDETNLCYDRTLPGKLSEVLGITIEEYEAVDKEISYPVKGKERLGGEFTAVQYVDWVTPTGADVLARYQQWHLEPFAVATRNQFGKGLGYYVGTVIKEDRFYDALIKEILNEAEITALITPPPGVEVSRRAGNGKELLFVINHTEENHTVPVPAGKCELISGETTGKSLTLGRYDVAVIKL